MGASFSRRDLILQAVSDDDPLQSFNQAPLPTERSLPLGPASWPRYADLPLTYHPVPDIA